jgi:hypothetical protein
MSKEKEGTPPLARQIQLPATMPAALGGIPDKYVILSGFYETGQSVFTGNGGK